MVVQNTKVNNPVAPVATPSSPESIPVVEGNMTAKNVPGGVKAIAILNWIGVPLFLFLAVSLFFMGAFFTEIFGGFIGAGETALTGGLLIGLGIVFIALAVLFVFVGRGLWKGQNWARITNIVFSVIGILGAIWNIVLGQYSAIAGLLLNGLIGGYLIFSKSVKAAFT